MKFTLIAFHVSKSDLHDPANGATWLAVCLDATKHRRVEICEGVYLYETVRDWKSIHQLSEALRSHNRTFCMLHSESELYGLFSRGVAEELEKRGITNCNLA